MTRSRQETERLDRLMRKRWGGRHRWVCIYCGRPANQIDHFYPESQGGTSLPQNLVPACSSCNSRKKDFNPYEWMRAVGISLKRAKAIQAIVYDPNFACLMTPPPQPFKLDYSGAKDLKRPPKPQTASKRPPEAPDRAS